MSWAKLDDAIYSHPKILRANLQAVGLYALSIAYSARHDLDGALPAEAVAMLARGDRSLADQLVELGLYELQQNGYKIHNFLKYNPSARQIRKRQKEQRERVRKHRERNALLTSNADALLRVGSGRVTSSTSSPVEGESEGKPKSRRQRVVAIETEWPEDFTLTAERRQAARAAGCSDPELAWEAWHQRCLAKGLRYVRWGAAWTTWLSSHGRFGCPCQKQTPRGLGKPSVRDMARNIAAKWAAEEAV